MRTEEMEFEVAGRENNHLWLRVLHGQDQGMRLSVPVRDEDHDPEVIERLYGLTEGDYLSAVLESEDTDYPDWRVDDLDLISSPAEKSSGALAD